SGSSFSCMSMTNRPVSEADIWVACGMALASSCPGMLCRFARESILRGRIHHQRRPRLRDHHLGHDPAPGPRLILPLGLLELLPPGQGLLLLPALVQSHRQQRPAVDLPPVVVRLDTLAQQPDRLLVLPGTVQHRPLSCQVLSVLLLLLGAAAFRLPFFD